MCTPGRLLWSLLTLVNCVGAALTTGEAPYEEQMGGSSHCHKLYLEALVCTLQLPLHQLNLLYVTLQVSHRTTASEN